VIHKDEYRNWKNHPVTDEFFSNVADIVEDLIATHLDGVSVQDHAILAQQIGLIRAYRSVINYEPEFNDEGFMIDDNGDIVE